MTKEEIRTISISKLNLKNCSTFLDVGGGTGSISIQASLENKGLEVFTIERNEEAVELIHENIDKFNINNIKVIKDYAPVDCFDKKIDAAFIGGSGGNLEDIIIWLKKLLNKDGILVINCIILQTLNESLKILEQQGFEDIECVQACVSRLEKLGKGNYFKPLNPTYIISCKRGR
ncbi:decarboxylating cobalt-precorrin-6B (C(15))-methyltransferase [Tepidibacter aestuarii]|uniref:decarboxylating cobalt-precorrin-6B (C(15))-methyltransferase n=1 Tax=Tepidibacter aestuarii TaxID=2925782 RepID=UPI0020BD75C8|nr:decarboxylating cobalt-precorrin-6B (C(15))-methyltransferase [Tepidibacter aestuarii]CAH2212010.1 Cobalt-precorrin-6B C(15)-methyltransferase (decarboxylating) [Tepidibacter aestuarii]